MQSMPTFTHVLGTCHRGRITPWKPGCTISVSARCEVERALGNCRLMIAVQNLRRLPDRYSARHCCHNIRFLRKTSKHKTEKVYMEFIVFLKLVSLNSILQLWHIAYCIMLHFSLTHCVVIGLELQTFRLNSTCVTHWLSPMSSLVIYCVVYWHHSVAGQTKHSVKVPFLKKSLCLLEALYPDT